VLTVLEAEAENRPKSAHRYNVAEQQQIYKSEIERIWKAQYDSLSRKDEPQLTEEDIRIAQKREAAAAAGYQAQAGGGPRDSPAAPSRASSVDREGSVGPDGSRKVLRIKRLVRYLHFGKIIRNLIMTSMCRLTGSGERKLSEIPL